MGFGLLALLMLSITLCISLVHPTNASAATTPPPVAQAGTGVTVTMLDAGAMGVQGTGTVTVNGLGTFDLTQLSGIYFNANALQDGTDWTVSGGQQYFHNGVSGATCPSQQHNSFLRVINGNTPGNIAVNLDAWLPETGTNTPGQCIELTTQDPSLGFDNIPVFDLGVGGSMNTFCGRGSSCPFASVGVTVDEFASTALFFENSSSQIIEAGGDPAIPGFNGDQKYIFNQKATGDFTRQSGNASNVCPDFIEPITATGSYVKGTLHLFPRTASKQPCPTGITWDILILTSTPSAYFATISGGTTPGGPGSGNAAPPDNCPIQNWALRWLVCPVITVIDGAIALINSYIGNLLIIPRATFDTGANPGKAYFAAWGDFRDLAVSLFIIGALIMVIGESAGFDLLDAYSIRKILPRLLTGGLAISLSWIITTGAIQLDNNLINWLPDMILSPFQGLGNSANLTPGGVLGTAETAGGIALFGAGMGAAAVGAVILLGVPAIVSLILTLFLAMLVAFITLTIRMMILVLWLITSPLWIACYILPTTQRGFTFGRDAGVTAMVAGIAVSGVVAAGQLIALVALNSKGFVPIFAPVAIIVSEMMIGRAFTFAGGLIGAAAGAVHGFHGGAFQGLKNYRKGQFKQNREKIAEGQRYSGKIGERLNKKLQYPALIPKAMGSVGFRQKFNPKALHRQVSQLQESAHEDEKGHILKEGEGVAKYAQNDVFDRAVYRSLGEGKVDFERELRATMGETEFTRRYGNSLSDSDAVLASLRMDGFDEEGRDFAGLSAAGKEHTLEARQVLHDRVMAARHRYGNSEALGGATAEANWGTGTGFKNTEIGNGEDFEENERNRARIKKFVEARGDDGNLKHVNGAHYHFEEVRDKENNLVYEKDSDGNVVMDDVIDPETGKPVTEFVTGSDGVTERRVKQQARVAQKLVIHDATGKAMHALNLHGGEDRDATINSFARGKGAAAQSGRADMSGMSFGVGVTQLNNLHDAWHEIEHSSMSEEEKYEAMQDAMIEATRASLRSAATGADPGSLTGGKPYSAEAIGREQFELIKERLAALQKAKAAVRPGYDQEADPGVLEAQRGLKQAATGAAALWDTMSGRSQEIDGLLSRVMMGRTLKGVGKNGEDMTLVDYYAMLANSGDPVVLQTRREYGVSTKEAKEEAMRRPPIDPNSLGQAA